MIVKSMASGKELGGTFRYDFGKGRLFNPTVTKFGHSNDVEIPHGVFEWHTHPQKCGMKECSLSSPSDTDVGVVLNDAQTENLGHFVFSRHGTFVMSLSPNLVVALKRDKRLAKQIQKQFTLLQRQFSLRFNRSRSEGEKDESEMWHQDEWMALAERFGIVVGYFKYPALPSMKICSL
eukprot:jgi/Mesvir1/1523/Mv14506-RA.1